MGFDVAISYCSENRLYALNLFEILREGGLSVYFSSIPKNMDVAGGNLREELKKIYTDSSVNIIIWSKNYIEKSESNSVVKSEYNLLLSRHISKADYKSLYIYKVDSTPLSEEFKEITAHQAEEVTFLKARSHVIIRLIESYEHEKGSNRLQHPEGVIGHRGPMKPCTFRLSISNYKQDGLGRWDSLGDCLVVPLFSNINKETKTYLIPSKQVPSFLSHPIILRTSKPARGLKKKLTMSFAKSNKNTTFEGMLFYISKNGHEYPHIYCGVFDRFLIDNMHKHASKID